MRTYDAYDLLEAAGRALYDEDWTTPLARSLGVNPDTMRKWKRRKIALSIDHDVLRRARRLIRRRASATMSAARAFANSLPPQQG